MSAIGRSKFWAILARIVLWCLCVCSCCGLPVRKDASLVRSEDDYRSVAGAVKHKEIFGFSVSEDESFKRYDWGRLTTSAWREDGELLHLAHLHDAKIVIKDGPIRDLLANATALHQWVQDKVDHAGAVQADGINFDLEEPLTASEVNQYTHLIWMTAHAFHSNLPDSQVSVDVPWSPLDIDGRSYDWLAIAEAADLLFVMAYDMQSQIYGRCVAAANSPYALVERGLQQWLALGIPASKLVLGLPWYGYNYPCQPGPGGAPVSPTSDICWLKPVPFRGAPCSDAAGSEVCYNGIMDMLEQGRNSTPVHWDELTQSPYFNFVDSDGSIHQMWFDDPRSLKLKYRLAAKLGLRGVGFWNLDCLDYNPQSARAVEQTRAMWEAVDVFLKPAGATEHPL